MPINLTFPSEDKKTGSSFSVTKEMGILAERVKFKIVEHMNNG